MRLSKVARENITTGGSAFDEAAVSLTHSPRGVSIVPHLNESVWHTPSVINGVQPRATQHSAD